MKKSKPREEKLKIRGNAFRKEYFKPFDLEACEVPRILSMINEVGEIAKLRAEKGKTCDISLANNSTLQYIEGLLRYQLIYRNSDEKFGIDMDWLILDLPVFKFFTT